MLGQLWDWGLPMVGTESRNRNLAQKGHGTLENLKKALQTRRRVVEAGDGGPGQRFPGG